MGKKALFTLRKRFCLSVEEGFIYTGRFCLYGEGFFSYGVRRFCLYGEKVLLILGRRFYLYQAKSSVCTKKVLLLSAMRFCLYGLGYILFMILFDDDDIVYNSAEALLITELKYCFYW